MTDGDLIAQSWQWLERDLAEWAQRYDYYRLQDDYYAGRHQLKFTSPAWTASYARLVLQGSVLAIRENLSPTLIDAATAGITCDWGHPADPTPYDRALTRTLRDSHIHGDAYLLAWPTTAGGHPRLTTLPPQDCVPAISPADPDRLDRLTRIWADPADGHGHATTWTATHCHRWTTVSPLPAGTASQAATGQMPRTRAGWAPATDQDGPLLTHPYAEVPCAWIRRAPATQWAHGTSLIDDIIPIQDGLNASIAHLLITQEAVARPYWVLLNWQPADLPDNPWADPADGPALSPDPSATPAGSRPPIDRTRDSIIGIDGAGPLTQLDPPDPARLTHVQREWEQKACLVAGIPPYWVSHEIGSIPSGSALRTIDRVRAGRARAWQAENGAAIIALAHMCDPAITPDTCTWTDPAAPDQAELWAQAATMAANGTAPADWAAHAGLPDPDSIQQHAAEWAAAQQAAATRALYGQTETTTP